MSGFYMKCNGLKRDNLKSINQSQHRIYQEAEKIKKFRNGTRYRAFLLIYMITIWEKPKISAQAAEKSFLSCVNKFNLK